MDVTEKDVLDIVNRLGEATSRRVAVELCRRGFECSQKAVAMMLLRCKKQGSLGRER